jgi:hypothetical protein
MARRRAVYGVERVCPEPAVLYRFGMKRTLSDFPT